MKWRGGGWLRGDSMDRDIGERWVIPQDQGANLIDAASWGHRLALASAAIAGAEEYDERAWLECVAEALVVAGGGHVVGETLLVEPVDMGTGWRVLRAAVAGLEDEEAVTALLASGQSGWIGEPTPKGRRSDQDWIAARNELWDDHVWRGCGAAEARAECGVYEFVRAVARFDVPRGQRAAVVQFSGSRPGWRPSKEARAAAGALAAIAARTYVARFVKRSLVRKRLLDLLSDSQRRMAPMLLAGLSEANIARRLGKSRHTIHDHVKSVYRAWGVSSRLEMKAVWAGTLESPATGGTGPLATSPPASRKGKKSKRKSKPKQTRDAEREQQSGEAETEPAGRA